LRLAQGGRRRILAAQVNDEVPSGVLRLLLLEELLDELIGVLVGERQFLAFGVIEAQRDRIWVHLETVGGLYAQLVKVARLHLLRRALALYRKEIRLHHFLCCCY